MDSAVGSSITLTNITHAYASAPVLQGVDLQLVPGRTVALLGANGAGKSTLLKTIAGELKPSGGDIHLDGAQVDARTLRQSVGFVPQGIALFGHMTVEENLDTFGALAGLTSESRLDRIDSVLDTVGLNARRGDRVDSLSGGLARRANIGVALMSAPRALLLDEPSAGVDDEGREKIVELCHTLRGRGLPILLVTHELELAERAADEVAIIRDGRVMATGDLERLLNSFFGAKRLVILHFDSTMDSSSPPSLAKFKRQTDGSFEGLLNIEGGVLDNLLTSFRTDGLAMREIRIVRPGLAELLEHVVRGEA
ncbi:MAG: ABC transporter ATP-binding protein [Gammaproteobacteria bacterium]